MQLTTHLPGNGALVRDLPHSETSYPPDFLCACEIETLRRAEETPEMKPGVESLRSHLRSLVDRPLKTDPRML